jgi:hypothetical protein
MAEKANTHAKAPTVNIFLLKFCPPNLSFPTKKQYYCNQKKKFVIKNFPSKGKLTGE